MLYAFFFSFFFFFPAHIDDAIVTYQKKKINDAIVHYISVLTTEKLCLLKRM
jgi:hypothetical protein